MIMAAFFSLASANSISAELNFQECVTLLGAVKFNQYLEYYCSFNGGVGDKLNKMYLYGGCGSTVPREVLDSMLKQVEKDSRERLDTFGKEKFCAANSGGYFDLTK